MGIEYSKIYKEGTRPDTVPECYTKPTFDPKLGFHDRKVRDPKMSAEEMRALKLSKSHRDYCAYLLKDLLMCKRDNAPIYILCKSELHNYVQCQWDDYVHRMKEFEREKRLRLRQAQGTLPAKA